MVEQLAHEHEQRDRDENEVPPMLPGDECGMSHGGPGAFHDPEPDNAGKGHGKARSAHR